MQPPPTFKPSVILRNVNILRNSLFQVACRKQHRISGVVGEKSGVQEVAIIFRQWRLGPRDLVLKIPINPPNENFQPEALYFWKKLFRQEEYFSDRLKFSCRSGEAIDSLFPCYDATAQNTTAINS